MLINQTCVWHFVRYEYTRFLLLPFWSSCKLSLWFHGSSLLRLTTFYFMAMAKNSSLMPFVKQLIVATNESTQLPDYWQQMSGAIHRRYTAEEIASWRCLVVLAAFFSRV
jgi:hypothetical protein